MNILQKDYWNFLRLLNRHHARYVIVGAYAVAYHGYVHATGDLDIFVDHAPDNARRLVKVLKEFGFQRPNITEECTYSRG